MPSSEEEQAAASVPVVAVVTGERATRLVADAMRFRAYHTRATSPAGMQATRHFRATIKGFNSDYGFACKSWADVAEVTTEVYRLIKEQRKAASNG